MSTSNLTVHVEDGTFTAHVAAPASERRPGIVLIQEIFGVNADMRAIARSYADRGYLALVPDLFWRFEPAIELDPEVESDQAVALELYGRFDENAAVEDLKATLNAVRELPSCSGKVVASGFASEESWLICWRPDPTAMRA
jgi:carboxymethylenebutenolidase